MQPMMKEKSVETHEFRRREVPRDGKCLFWSLLVLLLTYLKMIFGNIPFSKELLNVLNKAFRVQAVDYIRSDRHLQEDILQSFPEYKSIEKYCSELEQGELWGGQPELRALSKYYGIIICVINPIIVTKQNCILPSYYGEDNPLASKCVYIYHDGDHYEPLYLINKKNTNEIETMFDPNDFSVNDILRKFIHEKTNRNVKLGLKMKTDTKESPERRNSLDQTTRLRLNAFRPDESNKRKESTFENIAFSSSDDKQLPVHVLPKYYVPNKRVRLEHDALDDDSPHYRSTSESMAMEQIIQSDNIPPRADADHSEEDQERATNGPMVLNNEDCAMNGSDSESDDNPSDDA